MSLVLWPPASWEAERGIHAGNWVINHRTGQVEVWPDGPIDAAWARDHLEQDDETQRCFQAALDADHEPQLAMVLARSESWRDRVMGRVVATPDPILEGMRELVDQLGAIYAELRASGMNI